MYSSWKAQHSPDFRRNNQL